MGMDVIYSSFPTLTPSSTNKVVGAVTSTNYACCRHCIRILGIDWNTMKYITNRRAKMYIYNCYRCGLKITSKMTNRI